MADGQAHVPEQVKRALDKSLRFSGAAAGMQKQQIDVGERRQLAASIPAERNDGVVVQFGF